MHLIIILLIALIVLGPGKLRQIGEGLCKSIREFKGALSGDEKDSALVSNKDTTSQDTIEKKTL